MERHTPASLLKNGGDLLPMELPNTLEDCALDALVNRTWGWEVVERFPCMGTVAVDLAENRHKKKMLMDGTNSTKTSDSLMNLSDWRNWPSSQSSKNFS